MPPVARPYPRFIGNSTVEPLPYGRWAVTLRDAFAKACEPHHAEAGGPPGELTWFPERGWGDRVYVPVTAPVEGAEVPSEYFGFVSFIRSDGEAEPTGIEARADFTDVTAADNPDWEIDLNEDVIGKWRGDSDRMGDVTLIWGTPMVRGAVAVTAELDGEVTDQASVRDERFTLIAVDAVKGFPDDLFVEVALWGRGMRGAIPLARESLYVPDDDE